MRKLVLQYIGHPGIARIEARDVESPYGLSLALSPTSFHFSEWSNTHKILQSMAQRALVERERRLLGADSRTCQEAQKVLDGLERIKATSEQQALSKKELAHLVLEALVDFEHELGPD